MRGLLFKALVVILLAIFISGNAFNTVFAEDFQISIYWPPVANYTTDTQYDYIRDANINEIINTTSTDINTPAENDAILSKCSTRGLNFTVADDRIAALNTLSNGDIDSFADEYSNTAGVGGFFIGDEPTIFKSQGLARAYNRFLYQMPGSIPYLNLLPTYANSGLEINQTEAISQTITGSGYFVSSTNPLGQSFVTPTDCTYIDSIELYIDYNTWASTEGLTLTLWNSTAKTTRIASYTLFSTNNTYYPQFKLNANVLANTSYYLELTHNGGGNNSIGWVCCSTADAYTGGSLYANGAVQSSDLYFKLYEGHAETPCITQNQYKRNDGYTISSTNPLGQTFTTSSDCTYIDSIELYIDYNTWGAGESLTLTLWNSTAKTTMIGSCTLSSTNNGYTPKFSFKKSVSASTSYYWELTHNGGGNNSVGWVCSSTIDLYPYGCAYVNGIATAKDFYFNIFQDNTKVRPLYVSQTVQGTSYNVSSTNPLGQTFTTSSDCTYIDNIQLLVDSSSWDTSESLTLTLWNSTDKTIMIGSPYTISGSNKVDNPGFMISANVSANTEYYWELTHNGGGDNSIYTWSSNSNNYPNGAAYQNGTAQYDDFVFRIYGSPAVRDKVISQTATGSGTSASSSNSIGQTFRTPANLCRMLQFIELYIDYNTWQSNEILTLTVYDGVSKNQVLGKASMTGSNNGFFPRFNVNAFLKPDTTYYFELTHNGGGDNSVGWVCRSTSDVYTDGCGYLSNYAQGWDFYFRTIFSSTYQDYLEEWIDAIGPLSLKYLSYDHYTFTSGTTGTSYFFNLEAVRDMGLRKKVKIASYLQSVGINGWMDRPDENKMRYNAFTSLAYGVKGVSWFAYWTPTGQGSTVFTDAIIDASGNKTDLYTPFQNINSQIKYLGPTLMSVTSQDVYHSGTNPYGTRSVPNDFFWKPGSENDNVIISYFKNTDNRKYIMVVNKSYTNSYTYSFIVNPKPVVITEVSKATGLETATNYDSLTGIVSAEFAPGEGRLYALPDGY